MVCPVMTSTSSCSRYCRDLVEASVLIFCNRRSEPSTITTRISQGLISGYSRDRMYFFISPKAPAISTPVGPPPTTVKQRSVRRDSGSAQVQARSKQNSISFLSRIASAVDFRVYTRSLNSGILKKLLVVPVASTK